MAVYALLADIILILHFAFLLFTLGSAVITLIGGILKCDLIHNVPFRIAHLVSVLFVAFESVIGMWCPLTVWEYRLRMLAGQTAEGDITFVGRIIRKFMFYNLPDWFFIVLYTGFGLLVAALFVLFPPFKKRR